MLKKSIWYSIMIIFTAGFAVLSVGFYNAMRITVNNQRPVNIKRVEQRFEVVPNNKAKSNNINLVILGDSVAKGTGDEKGKGFSEYLLDDFKTITQKEISVENLGIDGLQSSGLLEQLQSGKLDSVIARSNFLVISIGGNDVRTIRTLNETVKEDGFSERQKVYLENLKSILKIIRKNSKSTFIIFSGLYNPYEQFSTFEDTNLINTWNYNTQQLIEEDGRAVFIPTYDLIKFNMNRYIAPDGLHPNAEGYQAISNRMTKSVENIVANI